MPQKKPKIAMAMSGGVDSSVSAWLLKKQGYAVTGFFIKFWSDPNCKISRENACCDRESLENARAAAKKIGIPFHVLDAKKIFKKIVVDSFVESYKNLTTPNPCVLCNKFIKFGWFLEYARLAGFPKIATGHYAQVKKDKENIFHLFSGEDLTKDQAYFLYRLNQNQLASIVFPVGKMRKTEVIKIAKTQKLQPKNKKESQEICFIDGNYGEFLKRHLPSRHFRPGKIINSSGDLIGRHAGLPSYTIGQRRGISQTGKNENRSPLYVSGFNRKKNELIVGTEKEIYSPSLKVKDLIWLSLPARDKAVQNKKLAVKIRYRHMTTPGQIKINPKNKLEALVIFKNPQKAVTPGQSAVFFSGREVLGGGIII